MLKRLFDDAIALVCIVLYLPVLLSSYQIVNQYVLSSLRSTRSPLHSIIRIYLYQDTGIIADESRSRDAENPVSGISASCEEQYL